MPELNPIPNQAYNPTSTHNTDTFNPRAHMYNDPTGVHGTPVQSTIGEQALTAFYIKKVLTESARQRKFGKLADTMNMPKHMGQRIRAWRYHPLLDDRNLNDQGIDARGAYIRNGNLYGSSKDIGKITSRLPVIQEIGGRVNRVGFSRTQIEGTFNEFGFFWEYTNDSLDFDSDPQLKEHMYREAIIGAEKITEDALQIDLINGAGTLIYAGGAVSDATMDETSIISYMTLQRLRQALDAVRSPKSTKIIKGSQNFDTRTLSASRILFVPSEIVPVLETLRDPLGRPAWIPIEQYADALSSTGMEDEIGSICGFRVIQVEEMKKWEGAGANANNQAFQQTDGKYDIFPLLTIGSEAFTTIGFNGSNGVKNKFNIQHVKPHANFNDPYGKVGLTSISWYYGILFLYPERIGLIKTVAPY